MVNKIYLIKPTAKNYITVKITVKNYNISTALSNQNLI